MEKFKNPAEEISYLKSRIAEKEKELNEKHLSVDSDKLVADQISRYRSALPKDVLNENYAMPKHEAEAIVLNLAPERHDHKISELLHVLQTRGIKNAMSVVEYSKDPHLDDDFHRFLVAFLKNKSLKIDTKKKEFRGLDMTLYEVVLAEKDVEEKKKPLKEIVSGMEQFFSGMMSVAASDRQNYFALEIANQNGSSETVFYVAVPNAYSELFQKQVVSIFANAKVREAVDDYNIFNEEGVSVGSYVALEQNAAYPFKTYEQFDHDPLNVILESFSKLQKDGEGAAMQIIFSPQGDYYNKKYSYAIKEIESGMKAKDALDNPDSLGGSVKKVFKEIFGSKKEEKAEDKKIETEDIEKIKKKIETPIAAVNIRLAASSKSRLDAERILANMESSFNQFNNPTSNALKAERIPDKKLGDFFREFSFRVYNEHNILPLNLREISSLIHFTTSGLTGASQLKKSSAASAPAPLDVSGTGTLLGINRYQNTETKIYISDEDRLRHFYTIGQTGTGKSTLLKNMIISDIARGNGVCMIDPHGIDILDVLANIPESRFGDLIYFDPSFVERPMALNMLEYDPRFPEQKTFVVNEIFNIFMKLYGKVPESMGPIFEQYFRNATMLVIEDPDTGSTLLDVSRVLSNKQYRELKLSHCKNPVVVEFWREVAEKAGGEAALANIVPYITSKFDVFLANDIMRPIVAQQKSSFDFREIMDNKKILLVNLSKGRLGDINANLIGLILVGKILMAALSRANGSNFPPFYLYIDEFQNITTNSIATILSEARKYKLSLSIAHQFIAQLEEGIRDAVFGNVGNICSFRVGSEDAEFLQKQFAPTFSASDFMNIANRNAYVKMLVDGKPEKPFNIETLAAPKGNPGLVETLKHVSFLSFGGERSEIEKGILEKYKK